MKEEPGTAGGSRRGNKRKSRGNGAPRGNARNAPQGNGKRRKRRRSRGGKGVSAEHLMPPQDPWSGAMDKSILGGRVPTGGRRAGVFSGPPDAFGLFCFCYLGVTPDDGYQKPSIEEAARRYGIKPDEVRKLLSEHKLDRDTVRKSGFDMHGAQLDIRLAPPGISRIATAQDLFEEYRAAVGE